MNISELIERCKRILYISRKPTDDEFKKVAKVTAIGVIIMGILGIIISLVLAQL